MSMWSDAKLKELEQRANLQAAEIAKHEMILKEFREKIDEMLKKRTRWQEPTSKNRL